MKRTWMQKLARKMGLDERLFTYVIVMLIFTGIGTLILAANSGMIKQNFKLRNSQPPPVKTIKFAAGSPDEMELEDTGDRPPVTDAKMSVEPSLSTKPLVIVGLGDSTTAGTPGYRSPREVSPDGFGNPESQYAYWLMKRYSKWKVINQGIRTQRTDEILSRFDNDVTRFHPDYVVVLAGVNDLFQGFDAEKVIQNLKLIYERAAGQKIGIVACTILPYNDMAASVRSDIEKVNGWIGEYAKANGYIFCDTFHLLENKNKPGNLESTLDGYHPDVSAYKKMGEFIGAAIEKQ